MENTIKKACEDADVEDHLHIRGEYVNTLLRLAKRPGSPPHTWRIHNHDQANDSQPGITSTYVENT